MNKKGLDVANVSEKDFISWCKENHKAPSKASTKKEFFDKIISGKLVKDSTGKLVKSRKRSI